LQRRVHPLHGSLSLFAFVLPVESVLILFMPYYRAKNSSNIGHGVGLTIVKRLSERFHWPLKIKSFPGEGTRIEVLFKDS
jgi:signal transduction histidine kinase